MIFTLEPRVTRARQAGCFGGFYIWCEFRRCGAGLVGISKVRSGVVCLAYGIYLVVCLENGLYVSKIVLTAASCHCATPGKTLGTTPDMSLPRVCRDLTPVVP